MSPTDLELAAVKARYHHDYQVAFADALAALTDRDRTVLAQSHADAMTIDQLCSLYNVHRVTASRWISQGEARLHDLIVDKLRRRLALSSAALADITALVRSELAASLARVGRASVERLSRPGSPSLHE